MKKVKYMFALLLLLLIWTVSGEIYQNYFRTFTEQFYYFDIGVIPDQSDAYSLLERTASDHGANVFAVSYEEQSARAASLKVFVAPESKKLLAEQYDIKEGSYNSFFSGETRVSVIDFDEIAEEEELQRYYIIGSFDQARGVRNTLCDLEFGCSYVHQEESVRLNWLIWGLWGLTIAFLLGLTWIEIQFGKKKHFIKISMGASAKKLVLMDIITDSAALCMIFGLVTLVLNQFISLGYNRRGSIFAWLVFLAVNALLHLSKLKYDYKEVLYGANINLRNMGHCYLLKAAAMMVTIAAMAVTVGLLEHNLRYFLMYDEIKQYEGYSFISLEPDVSEISDEHERDMASAYVKADIFYDYFRENKIALAVYSTTGIANQKYFVVNGNTAGVDVLLKDAYEEAFNGYYILLPQGIDNPEETAKDAHRIISRQLEGMKENAAYRIVRYDQFQLLYFDTEERSDLEFGFDIENNPIMIYLSFDENSVSDASVWCDLTEFSPNDIIYDMRGIDVAEMKERYHLSDISITEVTERCGQHRDAIARVILLSAVVFVMMLLIEISLIIIIIRMEYIAEAKRLAVLSVLGYGIWSKNRTLLSYSLFSGIIALAAMVAVSLEFGLAKWYDVLLSSILLIVLEMVFTCRYIVRIESVSVPKILKGGSL